MAQFDRTSQHAVVRRWQDWVNLVLGVWLFISPWVVSFGAGGAPGAPTAAGANPPANAMPSGNAAWDAWIFGVIIAVVALSALSRLTPWQEWLNLVIGIWLFIAPWALGFALERGAAWDHWIVGILVFLVSLSGLSYVRRQMGVDYAHAGDKPRDRP